MISEFQINEQNLELPKSTLEKLDVLEMNLDAKERLRIIESSNVLKHIKKYKGAIV